MDYDISNMDLNDTGMETYEIFITPEINLSENQKEIFIKYGIIIKE